MEGGDAMSATDELRRILNERGVEWESGLPTETIVREPNDALYVERPDGRMHVYFRSYLTPEQAIAATLGPCSDSCNCSNSERTGLDAATLGRGTCHMELTELRGPAYTDVYQCSECGEEVMVGTVMGESERPRWCPWCGRKVVDE